MGTLLALILVGLRWFSYIDYDWIVLGLFCFALVYIDLAHARAGSLERVLRDEMHRMQQVRISVRKDMREWEDLEGRIDEISDRVDDLESRGN